MDPVHVARCDGREYLFLSQLGLLTILEQPSASRWLQSMA